MNANFLLIFGGFSWLLRLPIKIQGKVISAKSKTCENMTITEREVALYVYANNTPWVRPVKNARLPIDVSIRLILAAINDVVEKDRILKLTGYLTVKWDDQIHIWNEVMPYACLDSLIIPTEHIWVPDVATINSNNHYDLILSENVERIRIYSNGTISYRPGGTFEIFCDFDITYFPFDNQTCVLQLESWRYTTDFQTLSISDPPVSLRYWIENEQWRLAGWGFRKYSVNDTSLESVFDRVEFELRMSRKVGYYLMNVIIPSIIISVAQMAVFTLPVDEEMKIHISFTCLLAYGVFQLMIIADMPRSSDHIPLLSIYIDLSMAYIAGSMLFEGAVFICLRKADDRYRRRKVPQLLWQVASILGFLLRIAKPQAPPAEDKEQTDADNRIANLEQITGENADQFLPAANGNQRIDVNNRKSSLWQPQQFTSLLENSTPAFFENKYKFDHLNKNHGDPGASEALLAADRHANDESYPHRHHFRFYEQEQWQFVADVIDRFTLTVYLFLIIATPGGMFGVLPFLRKHNYIN